MRLNIAMFLGVLIIPTLLYRIGIFFDNERKEEERYIRLYGKERLVK